MFKKALSFYSLALFLVFLTPVLAGQKVSSFSNADFKGDIFYENDLSVLGVNENEARSFRFQNSGEKTCVEIPECREFLHKNIAAFSKSAEKQRDLCAWLVEYSGGSDQRIVKRYFVQVFSTKDRLLSMQKLLYLVMI